MRKLAFVLGLFAALCATPAAAQVQSPQTLPANTVWGRLGISAGPGQAVPFNILGANLFISQPAHSVILGEGGGNPISSVAPGTAGLALVANGASADPGYQALTGAALSVPFIESLTISTNIATNASFGFNPLSIGLVGTDSASCTCPTPGQNIPTLFSTQENFGGSSINNGRIALSAYVNMTSATSPTNPYTFYVAQNAYAQSLVNDNGTNVTARGVLEGNVSAFRLAGAATFWSAGIGLEVLTDVETGASVARKVNLLLDNFAADTVQGSVTDSWIETYAISGSIGKNVWSQIDSTGGVFALTSTGTVIKLVAAGGGSTISTGFDFGSVTVTNNVLQWASSAWSLAGNGNATLNATKVSNLNFASGTTVSVGTCTGLGTGGTCALNTGSTPQNGKITLTTGTGPSTAGAFTLTFGAALGPNDTSCRFQVQNGAAAWNAGTTWLAQTSNTTSATAVWANAAVALTASTTYQIEYQCFGM